MAAKFDFHKFLQVIGLIGPGVLLLVPGGVLLAPLVPVIIHAIGEAEAIKGASGAEKKAHVLAIVEASVTVANTSGKVALDPAAVQAAAGNGIDAVIATVHIIETAKPVKAA